MLAASSSQPALAQHRAPVGLGLHSLPPPWRIRRGAPWVYAACRHGAAPWRGSAPALVALDRCHPPGSPGTRGARQVPEGHARYPRGVWATFGSETSPWRCLNRWRLPPTCSPVALALLLSCDARLCGSALLATFGGVKRIASERNAQRQLQVSTAASGTIVSQSRVGAEAGQAGERRRDAAEIPCCYQPPCAVRQRGATD